MDFRKLYIWTNNILKSRNKSLGTNLPKFILRPSHSKANSLPISTELILSVSSLWIDRIDRLLHRLVVIVEWSRVLILRATEKIEVFKILLPEVLLRISGMICVCTIAISFNLKVIIERSIVWPFSFTR